MISAVMTPNEQAMLAPWGAAKCMWAGLDRRGMTSTLRLMLHCSQQIHLQPLCEIACMFRSRQNQIYVVTRLIMAAEYPCVRHVKALTFRGKRWVTR